MGASARRGTGGLWTETEIEVSQDDVWSGGKASKQQGSLGSGFGSVKSLHSERNAAERGAASDVLLIVNCANGTWNQGMRWACVRRLTDSV